MLTPYDAVSDIFINSINLLVEEFSNIISEILNGLNIREIKNVNEET